MSQIGRSIKNIEVSRPLKSQSRSQIVKKNYMLIEELIQLIENVAATLASGVSNPETMQVLVHNLRIHGVQLESISKDTLDRAFVTFRNASQDERLNIMTRLNLLELIELRAKSWKDEGINTYYKHKATNVEPESATIFNDQSSTILMSTSPRYVNTSNTATIQQEHSTVTVDSQLLEPGELIRNSGKFTKPTKIPGKNYSKDEVIIRNADSGKVMGIKGRRVHMIEELSETIISFQRVNPGAKERLVQITGPNEEKINYAKQLIEDTIRRNASPVRLEPTVSNNVGQGGSCSSLASSNSDETVAMSPTASTSLNRNSTGGIQGNSYIIAGVNNNQMNQISFQNQLQMNTGVVSCNNLKIMRSQFMNANQHLLHSYSTNDASLGEYKYTVNVGQHLIKITGDNCELVRAAKLVLDDYFSSNEFLISIEAGTTFEGNVTLSPSISSTPNTPIAGISVPLFVPQSHQLISPSQFADSGIGLNYMAGQISGGSLAEGDDDVFIIEENGNSTPINGLSRSRRSHFSRKDSIPEINVKGPVLKKDENGRIVHEYERLIYYAKSPHSWALPRDWQKIIEKHSSIIRNKDITDESQRFDAEKYLLFVKSGSKRIITIEDCINIDVEMPENE